MKNKDGLLPCFSFQFNESPSTILAAWALLLRRSTREEYIPMHLFINDKILFVNLDIPENIEFFEYCKQIEDRKSKAIHLDKIDSSAVVKGLRGEKSLSSPYFTVGFSTDYDSEISCDLELRFKESQAKLIYSPKRLERDAIQLLADRLKTLVDSANQWTNIDAAALPMMSIAQENQILNEWNKTDHPWPEGYCIHHLFFEQVLYKNS